MGKGTVVIYLSQLGLPLRAHQRALLTTDAKAIAGLKQYDLEEQYDVSKNYASPIYFIPDDTLLLDEAQRLGIHGPSDLYGGVVPHLFVKTKSITHPLVDEGAERPRGWSFQFAEQVRNIVLPGYTVFGHRDLRIAATRMLPRGPIRTKRSAEAGGRGQTPITTVEEVEALREQMPAKEIATYGLVLEEALGTDGSLLALSALGAGRTNRAGRPSPTRRTCRTLRSRARRQRDHRDGSRNDH
jgi:hypothetical protein